MIPAFPRWVWAWAIALPWMAGWVNTVALLALHHGGVTHLTGISTEGAIGLATGDLHLLGHAAAILGLFTIGCAISAWIVRGERWTRTRAAGGMLLGEGVLLSVAATIVDTRPVLGTCLCALAIGFQNGTSSLVTGAVLRTSHLTGMFTDLGIAIGQALRGARFDPRRARICLVVIASFISGGIAGALVFQTWSGHALWLAAMLAIVAGVATPSRESLATS